MCKVIKFRPEAGFVDPLRPYHNRIGGAIMALRILTEDERRRFQGYLKRVEKTGCLEFTGSCNEKGYGRIWIADRLEKTHRVAFVDAGGVLTECAPDVLHKCDNPACCEPNHLFAGDRVLNNHDMARKNRGKKSAKGLPYGVFEEHPGRFVARFGINGKMRRVGVYGSLEEAARVASAAKAEYRQRAGSPTSRG